MEKPRRGGSTERRTVHWFAALLLLGSGIVLADHHARLAPDVDTSEVVGLDGNPLWDEEGLPGGDEPSPACMANEFSVPGQGVHVSGSVGGLMSRPDDSAEEEKPVNSGFVADDTGALLERLQGNATNDVAILVVDDFGPANHVVDGAGQRTTEYVYQVSHHVQQAPADRAELERWVQNRKVSHGALVLHRLVALVDEVVDAQPSKSSAGDRYEWHLNGARLIVQAVPLPNEDSQQIADVINDAVYETLNHAKTAPRVVVNMSWVLLPCDVVEDFDASNFEHFGAYLYALETENQGRYALAKLQKLVTWVDDEDPLGDAVGTGHDVASLAYVAAAGNFGLPYQMFPAAWPTVTGASAETNYSNENGVIERGGLFRFEERDVYYLGTSFTAPALSLAAALDMSSEHPECSSWSPGSPSPFEHQGNQWLHEVWC